MATRKVVRPLFPNAPEQYNQTYTSEVVRAFSVFLEQVQNPGDSRATTLTLTDLGKLITSGLKRGVFFRLLACYI